MLRKAIQHHRLAHWETLLDELDQIGNLFQDFLCFWLDVLLSKSIPILGIVLLRYQEPSINHKESDPVHVLRYHYLPAGTRLLVKAGAIAKYTVPPEHAELFELSLKDRCHIVYRQSVKHPLV